MRFRSSQLKFVVLAGALSIGRPPTADEHRESSFGRFCHSIHSTRSSDRICRLNFETIANQVGNERALDLLPDLERLQAAYEKLAPTRHTGRLFLSNTIRNILVPFVAKRPELAADLTLAIEQGKIVNPLIFNSCLSALLYDPEADAKSNDELIAAAVRLDRFFLSQSEEIQPIIYLLLRNREYLQQNISESQLIARANMIQNFEGASEHLRQNLEFRYELFHRNLHGRYLSLEDILHNKYFPVFTASYQDFIRIDNALLEITEILNDLGFSTISETNSNSFYQMLEHNPDLVPLLGKISENLSEAHSYLSAHSLPATFETTFNMAFGMALLGKDTAFYLNQNCGIIYFLRYPKELLESTYSTLNNRQEKPLTVIAANTSDSNGAFYNSNNYDQLVSLVASNNFIIFETSSLTEFRNKLRRFSSDAGRISTILIAGHGTPFSVQFSASANGYLSIWDNTLSDLRDCFVSRPTVILISCSTGKNIILNSIAYDLSNWWNARTIAPLEPSSVLSYTLSSNSILDVTYDVPRIIYE